MIAICKTNDKHFEQKQMRQKRITKYVDLNGKTVVITGANRGIGKHLAESFLRNGCTVVCVCRRTKPKLALRACRQGKCVILKANVNDLPTLSTWAKEWTSSGKTLDVLINNAGLYTSKPLINCDADDWELTVSTNLKASFFLGQLFARHMKKNKKGGVIINAGSFTSTLGSVNYGLYSITKMAIVQMTRCMAAEWAPYKIRVNAFSPGIVKTRMTAPAIEANKERVLGAISMNRTGKLEEVSNGVLFLASEASSYITGQNLNINGGKFIVQDPDTAWKE